MTSKSHRSRKSHRSSTRLATGALAIGLVSACAADPDSGSRSRGSAATVDAFGNADADRGDGQFGNAGDPTTGTAGAPGASPTGGALGESEIEASLIWIANSAQGTVSKIDTRTLAELGRFLTSPGGVGKPSRTSVAEDGDVAVANRGYTGNGIGATESGVTKIIANVDRCTDRNGNGAIETSTGADDILPWMQDECVAWYTPLPHTSTRPVQWAPAPAPDVPAMLWAAGASACTSSACSFDVYQLDGATGRILSTTSVSPPPGVDFITAGSGLTAFAPVPNPFVPPIAFGVGSLIDNYGPYGAAADAGGNVWIFNANTTHLVRVDAATLAVQMWEIPAGNGYGITVDSSGRVFLCGKLGISRFDPPSATWQTASPIALGFNGCMTDGAGTLWVGGGADDGSVGLHAFDTETLALINSFPIGTVKGVSIDIDGYVWGVGSAGTTGLGNGNTAWRLDPMTGDVQSYAGLTGAYSYSDMTGFGLTQAGYLPPRPPD